MHHIRSIKTIKAKDPVAKHVIGLKMRQIPLCAPHHLEIHGGKWSNPPRKFPEIRGKLK